MFLVVNPLVIKIPNNKIGIVEKLWSRKGSPDHQIISLNGETGYQPEIIRGGRKPSFRYLFQKIHICSFVTIPQGKIGYVFARDGTHLKATQKLGKIIPECNHFQDARCFLKYGGQKGPQREILREGTYAINLVLFNIITEDKTFYLPIDPVEDSKIIKSMTKNIMKNNGFEPIVIESNIGEKDIIGLVTTHEGNSLNQNDVVAPTVGNSDNNSEYNHENFQDIEKFLKAGGFKGIQHQILAEGTYYINRLFATVELIEKTLIDINEVGVVISYIGLEVNTSMDNMNNNELVKNGEKGVWENSLPPGKYSFNTYAGQIIKVPTTNFIIRWISDKNKNFLYDKDLREIKLITRDAFEVSLPLSVSLRIDKKNAPYVIKKFGTINTLVNQSIDPMVSAYFLNIGQTKTLIQLIQEKNEIQQLALKEMKHKFDFYHLDLEEVLIGAPSSDSDKIEQILEQLRNRQITIEERETYFELQKTANSKIALIESQSKAKLQKDLTESKISIEIEKNKAEADYEKVIHKAKIIETLGEAEANKTKLMGEADAENLEKYVNAYGGSQNYLIQNIVEKYAKAIEKTNANLVPNTVINNGSESENTSNSAFNAFQLMFSNFVNDKTSEKNLFNILNPKEKELIEKTFKKIQIESEAVNPNDESKNEKKRLTMIERSDKRDL